MAHFIKVRTVKTVIREREKKENGKKRRKLLLYQREITEDGNNNMYRYFIEISLKFQ